MLDTNIVPYGDGGTEISKLRKLYSFMHTGNTIHSRKKKVEQGIVE